MYLKRTLPFRGNVNRVFIIVDQSPRPASRQTLSRWTKNILNKAGLGDFTVHSGRSAASTCALLLGLPIDSILKQAGWKSKSMFVKYYMNSPYINCQALRDKYQFSQVWRDKSCEKLRNCEDKKIDRFKSQHDILVASSSLLPNDEPSQSTCTSPRLSDHWTSTSIQSILRPVKDVEHAGGECSAGSPWIQPDRIQTQGTKATRSPSRTLRQKRIGNPPQNLVNTTVSQKTTVVMTTMMTTADNTVKLGTFHPQTTQTGTHNLRQAMEGPDCHSPMSDNLCREKTKTTSSSGPRHLTTYLNWDTDEPTASVGTDAASYYKCAPNTMTC